MTIGWVHLEWWQTLGLAIEYLIKIVAIGVVPEGRKPGSSTAWLLAILLIPVVGLPMYLIFGSTYLTRRRHRIQTEATEVIANRHTGEPDLPAGFTTPLADLISGNRRLTALPALTGKGLLHSDYADCLTQMAHAIDQATDYVLVQIYIMSWDDATDGFFRALQRAVARGVRVQLLFDQVGSWKYPNYRTLGRRMTAAGIEWHLMLPLKPFKWRFRRPDLRNHRKMVIVDGHTGFLGSQNVIDRSYFTGKHQWVDAMVEVTGKIVGSMEMLFAVDWYIETGELFTHQPHALPDSCQAKWQQQPEEPMQIVPSGPGYAAQPNLRLFVSLIYQATERIVLCSPYFVPDESLLDAVTTACYRGVQVDLLVNAKSDHFMVGHAQSSYYTALLNAGVKIHLYPEPYILHTKFMVIDPDGAAASVVGSSNMDMRSFGLNFEVSLFSLHGELTRQLMQLADEYLATSEPLAAATWAKRGLLRRYVDNAMRLTSALQ